MIFNIIAFTEARPCRSETESVKNIDYAESIATTEHLYKMTPGINYSRIVLKV